MTSLKICGLLFVLMAIAMEGEGAFLSILDAFPGNMCSATTKPITSERGCRDAAKEQDREFKGTVKEDGISYIKYPSMVHQTVMKEFLLAQRGCVVCFEGDNCKHKGVWFNPYGVDKQSDLQYKELSVICHL